MKIIIAAAILAVGLTGAIGGRARAETVWHFPYKGIPYVTESPPTVRNHSTVHRRSQSRLFRNLAGGNHCRAAARR